MLEANSCSYCKDLALICWWGGADLLLNKVYINYDAYIDNSAGTHELSHLLV